MKLRRRLLRTTLSPLVRPASCVREIPASQKKRDGPLIPPHDAPCRRSHYPRSDGVSRSKAGKMRATSLPLSPSSLLDRLGRTNDHLGASALARSRRSSTHHRNTHTHPAVHAKTLHPTLKSLPYPPPLVPLLALPGFNGCYSYTQAVHLLYPKKRRLWPQEIRSVPYSVLIRWVSRLQVRGLALSLYSDVVGVLQRS